MEPIEDPEDRIDGPQPAPTPEEDAASQQDAVEETEQTEEPGQDHTSQE